MNQFNWKNAISLALFGSIVSLAQATMVMEWDFRTNENLTVAVGGDTTAFLLTNATVNTGAAVPSTIAQVDAIQSGYLDVPRPVNDGSGLITSNKTGEWRDYFGHEAFGTASVYIVFRPHFSGSNDLGGPPGRIWIFNYSDANFNDSMALLIESDASGIGPRFSMGRSDYNQPIADLPNQDWDSNAWYMIGASWAAGAPINLYLRQLDTNKPAAQFASSSISLIEPTNQFKFNNNSIYVGRRKSDSSPENADSDIALVRVFNNEFYTEAYFDSAYEALIIPEPSTIGLLGFAGFIGMGIRRWLR